ncbi:YGGT family protein [Ketogulonicigenium robustum]|uniref:YGGT family protein n=1 Tax=Ketogulonicigenium robustum TaxID=92947 RepID=A0A1W6P2P9_9RHOB|nr:YggT family protein [Ketogulonicigenium robustum]ARO15792.1 YGGT family protein [Ketogulonicigenium robustum]
MTTLIEFLLMILGIARYVILIYFALSWLITFQVLNLRQPIVARIWYTMVRLTEPVFAPVRRVIPPMGGIDWAPLVVILGISVIEMLLRQNLYTF